MVSQVSPRLLVVKGLILGLLFATGTLAISELINPSDYASGSDEGRAEFGAIVYVVAVSVFGVCLGLVLRVYAHVTSRPLSVRRFAFIGAAIGALAALALLVFVATTEPDDVATLSDNVKGGILWATVTGAQGALTGASAFIGARKRPANGRAFPCYPMKM